MDSLWCFCDIFATVRPEQPGASPGVTFSRGLPMSRPSRSHKLTTASFTYSYYLYTTYLTITIATKPCSSCTIRKPILDFFNGRRTVSTCFTCRLSIANSRKRARKPLGDIDPNKRRPLLPLLPKSPDRPAIRLSSRLNRPSSPLKRPRTLGLALEE